ncbi:MAG: deiodinase-like protein [Candidatus Korobacteraceae bacterium]
MFGFTRYNYDRFRREMQQGHPSDRWFRAPEPGDEAPGFALKSLAGETVKLADFKGARNVVITFGSATCPQTAASIGGLRSLASEFSGSDVEFLFLYVREAHPGADLPPHRSMEDKRRAAQLLREQEKIEFPILIDELGGEVHRKYGALPNASFLIDKDGRIAYRSLASHGPSLGAALEELLERQKEEGLEHAIVHGGEDAIAPPLKTFLNAYRAIERGGYDAVMNFRGELGIPGRVVLRGGRMAKPIAEHPAITITTAIGIVGAIGVGYWAGHELRKRHLASQPYDVYSVEEDHPVEEDFTGEGI